MRALAAGLVVLHHAHAFSGVRLPALAEQVASTGWVGVEIFFAISGFVLFLPWARGHWDGTRPLIRRFWANRARRILPAFWLNLFVCVAFAFPALLLSVHGLGQIGLHLTFLATFPGLDGRTLADPVVNGIYWTLAAEMLFYVTLPLVARCFTGRRWLVAAPVAVVLGWGAKLIIIAIWDGTNDGRGLNVAARLFPFVFDEFVAGIVLAAIWAEFEHRRVHIPRPVVTLAALIGLGGVAGMLYLLQSVVGPAAYWSGSGPAGWVPLLTFKPLLSAFAAVGIFGVCWSATTVAGRLFRLRPLVWLGTVSYGIYLWQFPVQQQLLHALPEGTSTRTAFLQLAITGSLVTVAWAAISWYAVEKPSLRRRPGPPATVLQHGESGDAAVQEPTTVPAGEPGVPRTGTEPLGRRPSPS